MSSNSNLAALLQVIGRLVFAFIFIFAGFGKLTSHEQTVGYIASANMPLPPEFSYWAAVAVELGGGILIVLGLLARPAALAVAVFSVVAAYFFHYVHANDGDVMANMTQMILFMSDISIAGGALFIAASGAGRWSLDAKIFGGNG